MDKKGANDRLLPPKDKPSFFKTAYAQSVLLGLVFFVVFAAYDTIQVFAKKIYPDNIGIYMTMCVYVTFTLGCFVAPPIINIVGTRRCIFIGVVCYSTIVIAGLIFFETGKSEAIILLGGTILGAGASLLWIGQGRLILDYSNDEDRGRNFSIFWSLYRGASLLGGILSYTYFHKEGNAAGSTGLYFIFLGLIATGGIAALFLADPKTIVGSDAHATAIAAELNSSGDGDVDESGSENAGSGDDALSWSEEVHQTFVMFTRREMVILAIMFWASGANEPYALSTFTRFFSKTATGAEMIFFYTGSILGTTVCGRLLDAKMQPSSIIIVFSIVHAVAFALACTAELDSTMPTKQDLSSTRIMAPSFAFHLWGLSDAMINTFLYWFIGKLFSSGADKTRALGVFKMLNSAAHVYGYTMNTCTTGTVQLLANMVFYAIGAGQTLYLLETMRFARQLEVHEDVLATIRDSHENLTHALGNKHNANDNVIQGHLDTMDAALRSCDERVEEAAQY
jgi:MFS family permease